MMECILCYRLVSIRFQREGLQSVWWFHKVAAYMHPQALVYHSSGRQILNFMGRGAAVHCGTYLNGTVAASGYLNGDQHLSQCNQYIRHYHIHRRCRC
jgi:hypothetical protein